MRALVSSCLAMVVLAFACNERVRLDDPACISTEPGRAEALGATDSAPACLSCAEISGVIASVESPAQSWCPQIQGSSRCPDGYTPLVCEGAQDMRSEGCMYVDNVSQGIAVWCCSREHVATRCQTDLDCTDLANADSCFTPACLFFGGTERECGLVPKPSGEPCADNGQCAEQFVGVPQSSICVHTSVN